jgi:hypothetical protein
MSAVVSDETTVELPDDRRRAFGWQARLQLSGCRTAVLDSVEMVDMWCRTLVVEIDMKAYGPPIVDRFGEGDRRGVTAVQRLTTSAIVVHCDPPDVVYVDVFSCRRFDPDVVARSAQRFFGASAGTGDFTERRAPAPEAGFAYYW